MKWAKTAFLHLGRILFIVILIGFFLLPLLWLVTAPFSSSATLRITLPVKATLNNFKTVLSNPISVRALFINSPIIAGGAMIGVTIIASLAAYSLARTKIPAQGIVVYILILFSAVVTGTAAMVPIFLLLYSLKLIDTHIGTILVYVGGLLPTGIFLMRGFMDTVPRSYEEAAIVSGAKTLQMFKDVVVPIVRPGMMVVAVWAFVQAWGDFLIPMILIRSPMKMPAPIAIYSFYTEGGTPVLTLVSAYSLLYMLPAIVLYLFVNLRYGFRFFGGIKR